ncbi:MAG: carbohydrate kinase family protein [Methanosarcinaceae archaeon]
MKQETQKIISVVGHTAIDSLFDVKNIAGLNESSPIIDHKELHGGGAANIAATIAILGGKCQLISTVGADFISSGYENHLESAGVDLSLLYRFNDEKIAKAFVFTDREHNQCSYFYWGASAKLKELEPPLVDFVHLATADPVFNSKIAKTAKFVSFDPGQDLVTYSTTHLTSILENTSILFTNRYEIKRVSEMTGMSFEQLQEMIDIIVVTYDSEGSRIFTGNEEHLIPVVPVIALDPTGAGDAYRAGFLLAYIREYPLGTCGQIGSTVASFAVESIGCQTNLPTWDKMKNRFEGYFGKLD